MRAGYNWQQHNIHYRACWPTISSPPALRYSVMLGGWVLLTPSEWDVLARATPFVMTRHIILTCGNDPPAKHTRPPLSCTAAAPQPNTTGQPGRFSVLPSTDLVTTLQSFSGSCGRKTHFKVPQLKVALSSFNLLLRESLPVICGGRVTI